MPSTDRRLPLIHPGQRSGIDFGGKLPTELDGLDVLILSRRYLRSG